MTTRIQELAEATAAAWSAVAPPNAAAVEFAGALQGVIAGFERLRGSLAFEDEPAAFLAALQAAKE